MPNYINPMLLTDSYKLSHIKFTSEGVQTIYSNFTPRFTDYLEAKFKNFDGGIVWFGIQAAVQKIFVEYWEEGFFKRNKDEVIGEAKTLLSRYIGMDDFKHFEALHDLGYMPICIKSLPEGCVVSKGLPCFTITNTHPDYQWLPNFLESVLSAEVWKPMTTATIGRAMKSMVVKAAIKTTGDASGADFQLHDFSFRGQSGIESGAASGAGFLLSTMGTDNIPSIAYLQHYYDADIKRDEIAYSVPAGEHSVTTLGIQIEAQKIIAEAEEQGIYIPDVEDVLEVAERKYVSYVIEKFPEGIVSYVADSYDYFGFLDKTLPAMKDLIEGRDGKFVVRGDSGDPVEIIAGIKIFDYSDSPNISVAALDAFSYKFDFESSPLVDGETFPVIFKFNGAIYKAEYAVSYDKFGRVFNYEINSLNEYQLTTQEMGTISKLFNIFGGHVNSKGYIELNEKIGMIYGDGINEERATEIFKRLEDKGFASTNVVFGIGSYTLNMLSRDDLGTAVKATSATVNGKQVAIYKDPKTDTSKKSARGLLRVDQRADGTFELTDNVSENEELGGLLEVIYEDGKMCNRISYNKVVKTLAEFDNIWVNRMRSSN